MGGTMTDMKMSVPIANVEIEIWGTTPNSKYVLRIEKKIDLNQ